jgi:DNA-binding MarR family transcriptional regulator
MNSTLTDYSSDGVGVPGKRLLSLLQLSRGLEDRIEKTLGEVELSIAKFGVLGHLVDAGKAIPLSELAARVNCVRSNVTQMVDRLEAEGLVRRVLDPSDRRVILAELTEEGRKRQTAGTEQMRALEQLLEAKVGADDRAVIRRAMQALG